MYTIYADDFLIYSPDVEELSLYNIVLTMEDNSAGTLSFNMVSTHPAFNSLKKLAMMIRIKDSSKVIWKGRIISDDSNIDNIKTIQCEGKMAFLNDSIFPEFDFSGAPEALFRQIIENHNEQVGENQRFLVGEVTVRDNNDYIVRSSENALRTWKAVKEKCFQSSLGGHLRVRYGVDGDYIDWLEDYQEISRQPISFGKNIIDLLINTSAAEIYTAIRPQGASIDGKRVNIAEVNDGRDYIVDEEKAAEYGIIYADPEESIWDDVTLPENLLKKASDRLKSGIALKKTIEVRAIDLHLTDAQIEALRVCSYVQVLSELHGVEAYYLLNKAEIHMDAPENTQYTLGAVKMALTDANKFRQDNIIKSVEGMGAAIPTEVSQLNNDANYTTEETVKEIIRTSGAAGLTINEKENTQDTYILEIISASGVMETPNLKGPGGAPGENGLSAYEIAVRNGSAKTEAEWLASLQGKPGKPGEAGASAYQIAVSNDYGGTEEEWLASLKGEPGEAGASAYQMAVNNGYEGTEEEWLVSLKGEPGEAGASAYQMAVSNGYGGTEEEWLASLKGEPGKDGTVKIEEIEGNEGDVLQYSGGKWAGEPLKNNEKEILGSLESVQENMDSGKLVDALVLKEVFQSVSSGKKRLALAITGKGVDTSAEETFAQMAENISLISGGGMCGESVTLERLINFSMTAWEGMPVIMPLASLVVKAEPAVLLCEKINLSPVEG